MLKTKTQKLVVVFVLILVCVLLITIYSKKLPSPVKDSTIQKSAESVIPASLEIDGVKYESEISSGLSAYDLMAKLREEGKVNFKEKDYPGMGKFIEEINGVKGSGDKFWVYYVNGVKGEIGVGDYKINSGDVITWKYESYN